MTTFKNAMNDWSDREAVPCLEEVSVFLQRRPVPVAGELRWAAVALAVMFVTAIPIYRQVEALTRADTTETVKSIAEETRDDVLLMDAVGAHLSRTIPAPMEPIMALIRDSDSTTDPGGRQQ